MEIQELTSEVRKKSIEKMDKRSPQELAISWSSEDLLYSGRGNAIFIILPTPGCAWALSGSGGCTMCSYVADSPLEKVDADTLIELFQKLMNRYELKDKTAVKIFASGSFLNPEEIPIKARNEILKLLNSYDKVEEVIIESRPEYVEEDTLRECCKLLPDKIFEVSIGLESSSDYIKKYRINKGFSNKNFEKAINNIIKLKSDYNIRSKAYIFIKPILTSEKDAIQDAVASAKYAEENGVDRISYCPATIHKGTLMEVLWHKGSYKPPWIWSIFKIMTETRAALKIPVIVDTSGFGSRRGPFNCKKCNKKFKNLIIETNLNQIIPNEFECECKNKWIADIKYSDITRSPTGLIK